MKYFLLEGEHLAPFDEFRHLEPAHHPFLQKGYDDGFFLFSGPQIPHEHGHAVERHQSIDGRQLHLLRSGRRNDNRGEDDQQRYDECEFLLDAAWRKVRKNQIVLARSHCYLWDRIQPMQVEVSYYGFQ